MRAAGDTQGVCFSVWFNFKRQNCLRSREVYRRVLKAPEVAGADNSPSFHAAVSFLCAQSYGCGNGLGLKLMKGSYI